MAIRRAGRLPHRLAARSVEPRCRRCSIAPCSVAFGVALPSLSCRSFASRCRRATRRSVGSSARPMIKHRPASSYEDRLGTTRRPDTALLWAAHRERLARLIGQAQADLADAADRPQGPLCHPLGPSARRLIVAALAAGPNRLGPLRRRLLAGRAQRPVLLRLDAWVTPPVYTEVAAHRACRRQRDGRRWHRDLPRAVGSRAERADRARPCAARREP